LEVYLFVKLLTTEAFKFKKIIFDCDKDNRKMIFILPTRNEQGFV